MEYIHICIQAYLSLYLSFKRGADEKEVKMHERLSSEQSSETVESDRLGSESGVDSTLEQRIDMENYHEIWDKISSDLDEIIRNTNKSDRLGYNNAQIIRICCAS